MLDALVNEASFVWNTDVDPQQSGYIVSLSVHSSLTKHAIADPYIVAVSDSSEAAHVFFPSKPFNVTAARE